MLLLHSLVVRLSPTLVRGEGLHPEGLGECLVLSVSLGAVVSRDVDLQALFGAVAAVTVLTTKRLLSVSLVSAGELGFEVALGGGDVDTLGAVPAFAAPRNLQHKSYVSHGKYLVKKGFRCYYGGNVK